MLFNKMPGLSHLLAIFTQSFIIETKTLIQIILSKGYLNIVTEPFFYKTWKTF